MRTRALGALGFGALIGFGAVGSVGTMSARALAEGAAGVKVDVAARVLRRGGETTAIDLAPDEIADAKEVTTATVKIGRGRAVVHVRVPSRTRAGVAWEAVVGDGGMLLYSGVTGFARGVEGERTGQALQIVPTEGGASAVVVGDVREDLHICGQAETLLSPRALDAASMTFRGATLQRLPRAQREKATRVAASSRGGPADAPLAKLLAATGASTAESGGAAALTDGDVATAWSEGRPGVGQGEFVTMTAPPEVPIARLAVTIAPAASTRGGKGIEAGAAPRSFYLVTESATFAVTLPEDAWGHAGAAYDIALPEPIRASCLSLVLDDAFAAPGSHPAVTVAELSAYSAFDAPGATLAQVAAALAGGGARAEAAAGVLKRAGTKGLEAVEAEYDALDAAGAALALDVAASAASCEVAAPLLAKAMASKEREVARKGRTTIERCGKAAAPALVTAVAHGEPAVRAEAAPLLASIAPAASLAPLAAAMGDGPANVRAAVRRAFARAAGSAKPEALAALLADRTRPADARLDLVRAASDALPKAAPAADAAIDDLMSGAPPFRTRYLLAEPLATLARSGDAHALERWSALVTADPDAHVRAHAAEVGRAIPKGDAALTRAMADGDPRVREAAIGAIGNEAAPSTEAALIAALKGDAWTFVRAAAAATLGARAPSPTVDAALLGALDDRSARVRAAAIAALEAHRATTALEAVRERMRDAREDLTVRLGATRALGAMCDRDAVEPLTKHAVDAALPLADEGTMQLGIEAIDALGKLHPPDLAKRLAPLQGEGVPSEVKRAAARAMTAPPACNGTKPHDDGGTR